MADPGQARQQVLDQAAQAAFVVNGTHATLYNAKADGAVLEETVITAFTPIARTQHLTLSTVELVPTVPGDSIGNSMFFLGLAWTLSPYLLAVSLVMQPTTLSRRDKLAFIAAAGAFASIAGFLVSYWLGAVPGQSLAMLYGFLNFEAVALTVFGLAPFVGKYLIPVALALFVFVSAPTSGGVIPYQMVPTFFDWLHPVMPLGNLIDAIRSIFYFNGTNMIRPTLVLCAWIALGAALITVPALLHRARQQPAPAAGPPGPPLRELPGPEPAAEPAMRQAPTAPAVTAANDTNGFGHPPPTLFGTVTDPADAPLCAASITIIDTDGHSR